MNKENIISLIDGFTIELNPKVRHKIKSIPLDNKNNVYITYLPDALENDILETVEFVSKNNLIPIYPENTHQQYLQLQHSPRNNSTIKYLTFIIIFASL